MWDNGASESFIRRDMAEKVGTVIKLGAARQFEMGKGMLLVEESTGIIDVKVEGYSLFWHFLCVPELSEQLIINAGSLQRWKIRLDPENATLIFDPKALRLKLVKQVVIRYKAEEGSYWTEVPALPGCFSQGETVEEGLENVGEGLGVIS